MHEAKENSFHAHAEHAVKESVFALVRLIALQSAREGLVPVVESGVGNYVENSETN